MSDQNLPLLQEYEINRYTMSISPEILNKQLCSRVLEVDGSYIVSMKPIEIIERSSKYFGSSYQGRLEATKEITGITHKAPIAIDPSNMIYFFPTHSPNHPQCTWISHQYVKEHFNIHPTKTKILFVNEKTIQLPISNGSFENQLYRTAQLRSMLIERIEAKDPKASRTQHFFMFKDIHHQSRKN